VSRVDFGPDRRIVRVGRRGALSGVVNTRVVVLAAAATVLCAAVFFVAVANGSYSVPLDELQRILTGGGHRFATTVVLDWRLPRALSATVFGTALGVSGAVFQSLTRNPLGSPDIIGFNTGAYTGALVAIIGFGGATWITIGFAMAGAIVTALFVFLLASRDGLSGYRFVVVGIGVAAVLTAVNSLIVLRAETRIAMFATVWGQGSLEDLRWEQALPAILLIAVLLPMTALAARGLRRLELGDDNARALGTRLEAARLPLILLAITLTAVVTSVCGPIAFLALAAPQIARLLTRSAGVTLVGSAAVGAVLLSASDVVAAQLLPEAVPVGIVTVMAGGGYLVCLLIRQIRRS